MSFIEMPYPKSIDTEKPTVFVGGIPKTADPRLLRDYIRSVNKNAEFHLVTDSKNRSRGFAFVLCSTQKEAQDFANQRHMYDNKVLDCKVSLHHTDYITSSLNNIREPKKIFVDKIPKKITKSDLEKTFTVYGEIEEIILIEKEKRSINFAYITYFDTESAQKCVKGPEIKYSAGSKLAVLFARPKFSKKMLLDIPPLLKDWIRQIQKGLKEYDPKDFVNLHVEVVNDDQTKASGSSYGSSYWKKPYTIIKFTPVGGLYMHPQSSHYQQLTESVYYPYQQYAQYEQGFDGSPTYDENGYITYPENSCVLSRPQQVTSHVHNQTPVQMMPMRNPTSQPQQGYYGQYAPQHQSASHKVLSVPNYGYQNQFAPRMSQPDAYQVSQPQRCENQDPYRSYATSANQNAKVPTDYTQHYGYYPNENPQTYPSESYDYYYYDYPENNTTDYGHEVSYRKEPRHFESTGYSENPVHYSPSDLTSHYPQYECEEYRSQDYDSCYYQAPAYKSGDKSVFANGNQAKYYPGVAEGRYLPSPTTADQHTGYYTAGKEFSEMGVSRRMSNDERETYGMYC